MNKIKLVFTVTIILLMNFITSFGQKPEVKNVDFAIVNDTMFVYYDLINKIAKDNFVISICVKTISVHCVKG
jgi:hypothetical protein